MNIKLSKNSKMIKKIIFIVLILGGVCILYVVNRPTSVYKGVVGYNSSYKYIPRKLQLTDFENITVGTEYTTIVKQLGEPNGMVGSGILWPYYQLVDGSCVILLFDKTLDRKREFTILNGIRIVDTAGRNFVFDGREPIIQKKFKMQELEEQYEKGDDS